MDIQEVNWLAARTAITILRSIIPGSECIGLDRVVLLPVVGRSFCIDEASQILAEMQKPLRCRATGRDGVLNVDYESLVDLPDVRRDGHAASGSALNSHDGRNKVMIVTRRERLVIPAVALTTFERQFLIEMPHMIIERSPRVWDFLRQIKRVLEPHHVNDRGHSSVPLPH